MPAGSFQHPRASTSHPLALHVVNKRFEPRLPASTSGFQRDGSGFESEVQRGSVRFRKGRVGRDSVGGNVCQCELVRHGLVGRSGKCTKHGRTCGQARAPKHGKRSRGRHRGAVRHGTWALQGAQASRRREDQDRKEREPWNAKLTAWMRPTASGALSKRRGGVVRRKPHPVHGPGRRTRPGRRGKAI